jgi:hypothetical protein
MHTYKKYYLFVLFFTLSNNVSASWEDSINRQLHDLQNDWYNWWNGNSQPAPYSQEQAHQRAQRESLPADAMTKTQVKRSIETHFRQVFDNTIFGSSWQNDANKLYNDIVNGNSCRIAQNYYSSDRVDQLIRGGITQYSEKYVESYALNALDEKSHMFASNTQFSTIQSALANQIVKSIGNNIRVDIEQNNISNVRQWMNPYRLDQAVNTAIANYTLNQQQQQHSFSAAADADAACANDVFGRKRSRA